MTEHRCTDGVWHPGKARECEACAVRRAPRSVKRGGET